MSGRVFASAKTASQASRSSGDVASLARARSSRADVTPTGCAGEGVRDGTAAASASAVVTRSGRARGSGGDAWRARAPVAAPWRGVVAVRRAAPAAERWREKAQRECCANAAPVAVGTPHEHAPRAASSTAVAVAAVAVGSWLGGAHGWLCSTLVLACRLLPRAAVSRRLG